MKTQNYIILIEDTNGNKFGGYVNVKVHSYYNYFGDPGMFIFSMKINGKNEMKKYMKTLNDNNGFYLRLKNEGSLFGFGGGHNLCINKKSNNNASGSYVDKYSSYENLSSINLFGNSGSTYFTPKRFSVIQMN